MAAVVITFPEGDKDDIRRDLQTLLLKTTTDLTVGTQLREFLFTAYDKLRDKG